MDSFFSMYFLFEAFISKKYETQQIISAGVKMGIYNIKNPCHQQLLWDLNLM
jgi:hypothetical protein